MSSIPVKSVQLKYGLSGSFLIEPDDRSAVLAYPAPLAVSDVAALTREVLENPLEFPPLAGAVVPGDHVTLAVDCHTPEVAAITAEIWRVLSQQSVAAEDVVIIQPRPDEGLELPDPRVDLPQDVREKMVWKIHDPDDESERMYLATTTAGERIYLARDLVAADLVIPIGQIGFDPIIGYRGTSSVFYPGLSSTEAIRKSRGQGHRELSPDDERPLRQLMDEISWLMGVLFSVQVIPATGMGVSHVLGGAIEAVMQRGQDLLADLWTVDLECRSEIVVIAIESDAEGHHWSQLGAALETARNLVTPEGRIIVLSELAAEPGAGIQLLEHLDEPLDAIKPLRKMAPPDLIAATQLASTADWARVYLLSQLPSDLVEDFFMTPLESETEVRRLLRMSDSCTYIGGAQHVYGYVRSE